MGLIIVCLAITLLAGLATGGRIGRLESLPVRGWGILVAALLAQLGGLCLGALGVPAGAAYAAGLAVSGLLAAAFLVVNRSLIGIGLVALGLLLNALVVAANGAMPVSAHAALRSGAGVATVADPRHEPATDATRLGLLGDVIPVPLPVRPEVNSPGDLLVAAGLVEMLFVALHGGGNRTRPGRRTPGRRAGMTGWDRSDQRRTTRSRTQRRTSWPRRLASAVPAPRRRPTTGSARTPDSSRPRGRSPERRVGDHGA